MTGKILSFTINLLWNINKKICLKSMAKKNIIYSMMALLVVISLSISLPVSAEEENQARSIKLLDGELLLPDDYNKAKEDKKCYTVCDRWGEDCILDKKCYTVCDRWGEDCILNPSTGSRKCRRVCKSFAEQCF